MNAAQECSDIHLVCVVRSDPRGRECQCHQGEGELREDTEVMTL